MKHKNPTYGTHQHFAVKGKLHTALSITLILCTISSGPARALGDERVVVPIPSIMVKYNNCRGWEVTLTYTATEMDRSVLNVLEGMNSFEAFGHYHASDTSSSNGAWSTSRPMTGNSRDKLATMNHWIFGLEQPSIGYTRTSTVFHQGACAAELNMRECVGVFLHAETGIHHTPTSPPTTLPAGMCIGIPPAVVSCQFETGLASIDLGTSGKGPRSGNTYITYSCTGATTVRVQTLNSEVDDSGIEVDGMFLNGHPLPYIGLVQTTAPQEALLSVNASVTREGHLATNKILRIDIP